MSDSVNHPLHYNYFLMEVINIIENCLTEDEFKGYLKGNIIKYRMRAGWKDYNTRTFSFILKRDEDLAKSNWYQDKLFEFEAMQNIDDVK